MLTADTGAQVRTDGTHCDLYDGGYEEKAGQGQPRNMIPWDTLAEFFAKNLK